MRDYKAAQDVARKVIVRKFPTLANDVDDVLQDAAVKAIIHEDQFNGRSQFNTWFTSIAIREALIRLRKGCNVQWCELTDVHRDQKDDQLDVVLQAERAKRLHRAARRLSPTLREEFPRYLAGDRCGVDERRKGIRFRMRKRLRVALEGIV